MRTSTVTLLGAIAAIFVLALATTTASALRSLEARGGPNVAASGHLTFFEEGREAGRAWWCDITLLRTVSSVIPKINGTLIGKVTGVAIDYGVNGEHCGHGSFFRNLLRIIALKNSSLTELEPACPESGAGKFLCNVTGGEARLWKLIYEGFEGSLPEITGTRVRIERAQFKIDFNDAFGVNRRCLYRGTVGTRVLVERKVARQDISDRTLIPLFKELTMVCPRNLVFDGALAFTPALTIALL
jgi:hypothetical protein